MGQNKDVVINSMFVKSKDTEDGLITSTGEQTVEEEKRKEKRKKSR